MRCLELSIAVAVAAGWLAGSGCAQDRRDRGERGGRVAEAGAPDSAGGAIPADTGAPHVVPHDSGPTVDASVSAALARFRSRVPADVLVRRRACPFECCTYRDWTAQGAIPVVAVERGTGAAAFTIAAGQRFRADSGNVWITGLQLVAVQDSVADRPYWAFGPGDTLVVLDPIGEGYFHVWHEGRVQEVEGFWGSSRQRPVARTLGEPRSEWWVHLTLPDGRAGWFHAARAVRFSGADACG